MSKTEMVGFSFLSQHLFHLHLIFRIYTLRDEIKSPAIDLQYFCNLISSGSSSWNSLNTSTLQGRVWSVFCSILKSNIIRHHLSISIRMLLLEIKMKFYRSVTLYAVLKYIFSILSTSVGCNFFCNARKIIYLNYILYCNSKK